MRRSMSSSRSKSASSAWRYSVPRPASRSAERFDVGRVELRAGDAPQLVERLERVHRRAIGVRRGEGVVDLGHRDDSRDRGDLVAAQALRVAAAVDALVMCAHDLGHGAVDADVAQQLGPDVRVAPDAAPVGLRQPAAALHHAVRERELADVVQEPGGVGELLVALGHAAVLGDVARERRDSRAVAAPRASRARRACGSAPRERPTRGSRTAACARARRRRAAPCT